MNSSAVDFAIIGGQKCGSSFLKALINDHPDVQMVPGETPHLESPDYEKGGLRELQKELGNLDKNKLAGIKRPTYLTRSELPERLHTHFPDIKIIAVLRNPLDRIKSAYFHKINRGYLPPMPLNKGMEALLSGSLQSTHYTAKDLLAYGNYGKSLERYKALFGDNLLVLNYNDLVNDRERLIENCYRFLGIESGYEPKRVYGRRPQKVNYSLISAWLNFKMAPYRTEFNQERTRGRRKKQTLWDKLMFDSLNTVNSKIVKRIFNGNSKPEFTPEMKQQLIDYYKDDFTRIQRFIQVDFESWFT